MTIYSIFSFSVFSSGSTTFASIGSSSTFSDFCFIIFLPNPVLSKTKPTKPITKKIIPIVLAVVKHRIIPNITIISYLYIFY